jgi:hypothetical protein
LHPDSLEKIRVYPAVDTKTRWEEHSKRFGECQFNGSVYICISNLNLNFSSKKPASIFQRNLSIVPLEIKCKNV